MAKTAFTSADERFMRQALTLARRGEGFVEPNPMVGAVVVRGGKVIGKGYHKAFGAAHAEVNALAQAGPKARDATIYVTLEPCCHWGKTPPCTDALLASGVSRVVVAMVDPFARVRGRGVKLLRKHGVQVDVGLLQEEARSLNAPFETRLKKKRPYVIAKWAQSLDGCIATASGQSKWISSETSRAWVQSLRGRMDAIVVGIGTALADDPLLMARPERGRDIRRLATRIVVDTQCRLPVDCQLMRTVPFAPLLVVHGNELSAAAAKRRDRLADRGGMMLSCPCDKSGRVLIAALLKKLAEQDYTNILVEGGPELMSAFLHAGCMDEIHVFNAPLIIGGRGARHAIAGPELADLADATRWKLQAMNESGGDAHLVFTAR